MVIVQRGGEPESRHFGSVAVTDASGELLYSAGNPGQRMFARSAMKPFQLVPVISSGAADRYGFGSRELAVSTASHKGERIHTELVERMLERLGLSEKDLRCGTHEPYNKPEADRLIREGKPALQVHNNCSGKHTAMLALSLHLGSDIRSYEHPDHPVQQLVKRTFLSLAGMDEDELGVGVDGCTLPTFSLPLSKLAKLFALLGDPSAVKDRMTGEALDRIAEAITAHPELVSGEGGFDTELARVTGGRLVGKIGAEGAYGLAVRGEGIGIAVTIEDGNSRGTIPAVMEVLTQLSLLSGEEYAALKPFHKPAVLNRRDEIVGVTEPVFRLS